MKKIENIYLAPISAETLGMAQESDLFLISHTGQVIGRSVWEGYKAPRKLKKWLNRRGIEIKLI